MNIGIWRSGLLGLRRFFSIRTRLSIARRWMRTGKAYVADAERMAPEIDTTHKETDNE